MKKIDFLPLGSVVTVKNNPKKLVIVSRGLKLDLAGEQKIKDYGSVTYPEGMIGDQIVYFDHKDIDEILFKGYEDHDNQKILDIINKTYQELQGE